MGAKHESAVSMLSVLPNCFLQDLPSKAFVLATFPACVALYCWRSACCGLEISSQQSEISSQQLEISSQQSKISSQQLEIGLVAD